MTQVSVTAGSRLHFGLVCAAPGLPWHYGGIGLMLQQPAWQLQIRAGDDVLSDCLQTSQAAAERTAGLLDEFRLLNPDLPPVLVQTHGEVPFHAGLGAGTQLTLALGTALLLLSGQPRPSSIADLAIRLGRRRRSAIGTFGFDHGGFIVDRGRSVGEITRVCFPEDWRMVLLTPTSSAGLSGSSEETFFGQRTSLPNATVQLLADIIETKIVPSLQNADLPAFREALANYGQQVGQYFAQAQGGIFAHPVIRQLVDQLEQQQISGAVQSSWGPTVAIPVDSQQAALQLQAEVRQHVSEADLQVTICEAMNCGATVKTTAPESRRLA